MPDLTTWLTGEQAAARLEMNVRTLERMGAEGPERRLRKRPGKKAEPVYNPKDIEKLWAVRNPTRIMPLNDALATTKAGELTEGGRILAAAFQRMAAAAERQNTLMEQLVARVQPVRPAVWIAIDEAAARSGLSERTLRRLAREGVLSHVRERRLKILQSDLDDLALRKAPMRALQAGGAS